MNRAAKAAAPLAARYFGDASRDMTLQDPRAPRTCGASSRAGTPRPPNDKLYKAFKPVVSRKVGEVGATRAYKDMMAQYESVPLMGKQSLDLDDYCKQQHEPSFRLMSERLLPSGQAAHSVCTPSAGMSLTTPHSFSTLFAYLNRKLMVANVHDLQWARFVFRLKFAKEGWFVAAVRIRVKDVGMPLALRGSRMRCLRGDCSSPTVSPPSAVSRRRAPGFELEAALDRRLWSSPQ